MGKPSGADLRYRVRERHGTEMRQPAGLVPENVRSDGSGRDSQAGGRAEERGCEAEGKGGESRGNEAVEYRRQT